MTNVRDIITVRNDKSQVFEYTNPIFNYFVIKNSYSADTFYYITEHWHEEIEFLCVLDGCLDYKVNGTEIHLEAGQGIFVNSRRIHSNWSKQGESCVLIFVIFSPSSLCGIPYIDQQYIKPLLSNSSMDYLILRQEDWTKAIIDDVEQLGQIQEKEILELSIMEMMYRTLRKFQEHIDLSKQYNSASPVHLNTFKCMMEYIQLHYMEKISLDEIAEAGSVGKTLCAKLFKKYVSKTPGEYLIQYRIAKSMELLSGEDMSITDIAYATGFTSASHYTKTFREIIGCTPHKYRAS